MWTQVPKTELRRVRRLTAGVLLCLIALTTSGQAQAAASEDRVAAVAEALAAVRAKLPAGTTLVLTKSLTDEDAMAGRRLGFVVKERADSETVTLAIRESRIAGDSATVWVEAWVRSPRTQRLHLESSKVLLVRRDRKWSTTHVTLEEIS